MICADTVDALASQHQIVVLTSTPRHGMTGIGLNRDRRSDAAPVRRELPLLKYRRSDTILAPVSAFRAARMMRAALAQTRPDLIFVWNLSQIPHSALWVAQQSGLPIAFYIASPWLHGIYADDRFARHLSGRDTGLRRVWALLMQLVNMAPGLRIAPGAPLKASVAWVSQATRAESPPPPYMHVDVARVINPSTRRYERFAKVERKPQGGDPLIAFVGRLESQKGPEVALRALAHLVTELGVSAQFELAGPGEPDFQRSLEQLARELKISDRVRFRGPLGLEDVIELFERAHLLVVPSVWQEPMATVCIEAAFARLPLVASLSGGMPEALRPDVEAIYFPIGDWRSCAEAFAATLGDRQATAERVQRARKRADEFSFDRFMAKIAELLDATIACSAEH